MKKSNETPSVFLLLKEDGKVYVTREPVPVEPKPEYLHQPGCTCSVCGCRIRVFLIHEKRPYEEQNERIKAQAVVCEDQGQVWKILLETEKPAILNQWGGFTNEHKEDMIGRFYEIKGYEVEIKNCLNVKALENSICECYTYESCRKATATLRPVEDKKEKIFPCSTEFVPAMPGYTCPSEDPIIRKLRLYPHGLVTTDEGREVGQWTTLNGKIVIISSEI